MVWGGISIGGRTDLHIIRNGTLTGRRYADEILRPYVIPYAVAIGDSFVFQDDNARPHRARLVENMLEAETIQRMEWPACSPDLNPIEHVWDMLGQRIAARPRPPATVRDLEIALLEEWNSIPQSQIDNLIASMANSKNIPVAPQPPYSPDLSPCGFFLFPKWMNHLEGHHFGTLENIQTAITDQLKAFPISEFHQCCEEWKKRLQCCVASEGSYFEGDNDEL
ncbi:transposable element Tcb2 transposase [Trichonephila clavipes]|nr:transposable element Tcb2 transposase [Trichonephila clavipes]